MSTAVWHNRDEWLSLLEDLFDPPTKQRLEGVGVSAGWHAIEVGAGRGSIAVSWLKPGGVPVAEEPWIDVARLAPDPIVARVAESLGRTLNSGFVRRLPLALRGAGLERVRAEAPLRFFDGGSKDAAFVRRVLEGECAKLVASGELEAEDVRQLQARFDDPGFCDCGWPRIAAMGWKPGQR